MQSLDITEFNNTGKWAINRNPRTGMYEIKNAKNFVLPGTYTSRRYAEAELKRYLEVMEGKREAVYKSKEYNNLKKQESRAREKEEKDRRKAHSEKMKELWANKRKAKEEVANKAIINTVDTPEN